MRPTIVLFPGSLGDCVCFLPALRRIATRDQELVLVVRDLAKAFLDSATCFPSHVSLRTISLDEARFARLFTPSVSPRDSDLDHFLSPAGRVLSWCGAGLPQVKIHLERYLPGRVQIWPFFRGQADEHASTYYLRCLGETVADDERRRTRVAPKDHWCDWSAAYWRQYGLESKHVLVIHPGSGGQRKRWAADGFQQVAAWWTEHADRDVLILLGPAESDEEADWRRFGRVETSLALGSLGSLLQRSNVYLGNDSGVSHLAGAVNARGVVIFGPTRPEQWRPLGARLSVVYNRGYRVASPDQEGIGMDEVTPAQVVDRLRICVGLGD